MSEPLPETVRCAGCGRPLGSTDGRRLRLGVADVLAGGRVRCAHCGKVRKWEPSVVKFADRPLENPLTPAP